MSCKAKRYERLIVRYFYARGISLGSNDGFKKLFLIRC